MESPAASFDQKHQDSFRELEALRVLYEQYFSGVLKIEPTKEHQKWLSSFQTILQLDLRTTSQKFKRNSLQARYLSLRNLWSKISRQIEEGSIKRPLSKKMAPPPAPNRQSADLQMLKAIEKIYQTVLSHAERLSSPVSSREEFQNSVLIQIREFREKNPKEKMEVCLQKASTGELRVSVRTKS
jgi:hypothetical protein